MRATQDRNTAALQNDHTLRPLKLLAGAVSVLVLVGLFVTFTGDTLAPDRRRHGLGCEPMTCPPNAFADDVDVIRLDPGASVTARWGARLH